MIKERAFLMGTYSRPAATRSYDAIYADICKVSDELADNIETGLEFWRVQAEACERKRDLWNEIVWQAANDSTQPGWARIAAITTRDHYASAAREARAMAEDTRSR